MNHYTSIIKISHVIVFTAFFLAQLHNSANVILRHNNGRINERLFNMVDNSRIWEEGRVIYHLNITVSAEYLINNVRCGSNQAQIIFALQTLLDNVHVQQAQKAAAEAKAQRGRCFRLKYQRSIVQLQLFQSIAQVVVIGILYRIQTAVYHRGGLAIARQRCFGRIVAIGYGIAYACILNVFDAGSKEAYLALLQLINIDNARLEVTYLGNIKFRTGCHHANLHPLAQTALHNAYI